MYNNFSTHFSLYTIHAKTRISGPYGARTLSRTVQLKFVIRTVVPQQRELTPTHIASKRYVCIAVVWNPLDTAM
jgi:hypothetical protein